MFKPLPIKCVLLNSIWCHFAYFNIIFCIYPRNLFLLLNIMFFIFSHISLLYILFHFYIIFHCVTSPQFVHSCVARLRLYSSICYCKQNYYEHFCTCLLVCMCKTFLGHMITVKLLAYEQYAFKTKILAN